MPKPKPPIGRALEFSPDAVSFRARLAMILEQQGWLAEALAEAMNEKADWARWNTLGILYFLGGHRSVRSAVNSA